MVKMSYYGENDYSLSLLFTFFSFGTRFDSRCYSSGDFRGCKWSHIFMSNWSAISPHCAKKRKRANLANKFTMKRNAKF